MNCKVLGEDGLYIKGGCEKVGHNILALLPWRSEVTSSPSTECGLVLWLLSNSTQWKQGGARSQASALKHQRLPLPVSYNTLWKTLVTLWKDWWHWDCVRKASVGASVDSPGWAQHSPQWGAFTQVSQPARWIHPVASVKATWREKKKWAS